MNIEEKKKEIEDLTNQQLATMKKAVAQAKEWKRYKPKNAATAVRRALKAVANILHCQKLEIQKRIIASQPNPKHPEGGISSSKDKGVFISKEEKIINLK